MQRPERALVGCALDDDSRKDRLIAADREVTEDEAGRTCRDQLLQNQRLNLSRKPLTAASSEVPVVQNLDGSVRVAEHIALRANTLVFADDIFGQDNDLLVVGGLLWNLDLLLGLILFGLSLFTLNLLDLNLLDLLLGLRLVVRNRDLCLLLLFLFQHRRLPFGTLRGSRLGRSRLRLSIARATSHNQERQSNQGNEQALHNVSLSAEC